MTGQNERLGIELYQQQNYAAAEPELQLIAQSRPTWAEGWRYLGFCLYALGKHDEAASSLERAVGMEPDNAETRYGLGLVRAGQQRADEAISCFEECLRLNPGHSAAKFALVGGLVYRGQARLDAKDYDRGGADLERAIKLDRKNPAPVIALGKHYASVGEDGRAGKVVSEALAYIPSDAILNDLANKLNVRASSSAIATAQQTQARQTVVQSQEVPCPACKRPIMPWAVTCPHCSTQLKARPTSFDHLKGGPSTSWQEVAYYIVSALWLLDGVRPLLTALAFSKTAVGSSFAGFFVIMGLVQIAVAVGLLFRVEWLQFIAKIFCIISLIFGGLGLMASMMMGFWGAAAVQVVSVSLSGLMVYLISYMDG